MAILLGNPQLTSEATTLTYWSSPTVRWPSKPFRRCTESLCLERCLWNPAGYGWQPAWMVGWPQLEVERLGGAPTSEQAGSWTPGWGYQWTAYHNWILVFHQLVHLVSCDLSWWSMVESLTNSGFLGSLFPLSTVEILHLDLIWYRRSVQEVKWINYSAESEPVGGWC